MGLPIKWVNHIKAWQNSGLRPSVYCKQQNLNYKTFSARLSDYRKVHQEPLSAFIPVEVKPLRGQSIVLKHGKGHQVMLPATVSAAWLGELLRCLD